MRGFLTEVVEEAQWDLKYLGDKRHNGINIRRSKNRKASQPLYVSYIFCLQKNYWSRLIKGTKFDGGERVEFNIIKDVPRLQLGLTSLT